MLAESSFEEELPLFFDLLEVPDPEHPAAQLGEEVRLRRVFAVVRQLARRRTERDEGLLVLLEDLHWLDEPSRQFFEQYVESYPGTRTVVLANFRPEFHAPWMRHSYYRQIPLAPLDSKAVGEMISHIVGTDPTLAGFADHIIPRTGGNPFFVEEVVRMLVEDGALEGVARPLPPCAPGRPAQVPADRSGTPGLPHRPSRSGATNRRCRPPPCRHHVLGHRALPCHRALRGRPRFVAAQFVRVEFLIDEAPDPHPEYRSGTR